MTTKPPETMFVNPLLALLFEAGVLQTEIEHYVAGPAMRELMLRRVLHIARLAECIKKPGQTRVSDVYEPEKPGPINKEYPFPVIRGGKDGT